MSIQTFEYCSLHYLNQWLNDDKIYSEAFANNDDDKIKEAVKFYRVARTLHTKFDEKKDLKRYAPLLEILDLVSSEQFQNNPVDKIIEIEKRISEKYGNRKVLSATTKLLWLKMKHPIVIYDSKARKALNSKDGNFQDFYEKWHHGFIQYQDKIKTVCSKLSELHLYAIDQEIGTKDYIEQISSEAWFHERVFDIYLWHKGGKS